MSSQGFDRSQRLSPEAILMKAGITAGANPKVVDLSVLPLDEVVLPTGLNLNDSIVKCRPGQLLDLRGVRDAVGGLLLLNGARVIEQDQSGGQLQVVRVPLTQNLSIDDFGSLRLVDLQFTIFKALHTAHPEVFEPGELGPSNLLRRDTRNPGALSRLLVDVLFYRLHPTLPLENVTCSLESYKPETPSQEEALFWARKLCGLPFGERAAGLFLEGSAGVGKTHLAVSTAKEFLLRGLPTVFMTGKENAPPTLTLDQLRGVPAVWILDDVNSPYGAQWDFVKKVAQHAHNYGGIVLVTSNTPYSKLIENGFATDSSDRERILDRMKGIFKVLPVHGESRRSRTPWYAD